MCDLNEQFRRRIGFAVDVELTFDKLGELLERAGRTLPFENLALLAGRTPSLSRETLQDKIVARREGGLCYELNATLYFFLIDNGFDVSLIRAVVYDEAIGDWGRTGRTHVAIMLRHDGEVWLVDTGFGANLPLVPIPLRGATVASKNGEFRIRRQASAHGDCILEIRIRHRDSDWKSGYAFDSSQMVQDLAELDEVQSVIRDHPDSPFNTKPLLIRLTGDGSITLTERSMVRWADGEKNREDLDDDGFRSRLAEFF